MCSEPQKWNHRRRILNLMLGILLAPVAAAVHAQTNYALVPVACAQGNSALLHIAPTIALLASAAGLMTARRCLHSSESERVDEAAIPIHRSHFLASFGILFSSTAMVFITMSWIPVFLMDPCQ